MEEERENHDIWMLKESERRFRALVTASSEVVYVMSPDWSEMRQLYGRGFLADTEKPSRTWLKEYILPDDQAHVTAVINEAIRAIRTKSIFELQHRVRREDGSVGWTFSRAVPLMDAHGEIIEWFGAASDVSARKKAEEELEKHRQQIEELLMERTVELRQSEQDLRGFIEESPLGIRIVTAEGETLYANRSLLNMYGFDTIEELKNTPVDKCYTPESYAEHLEREAKRQQGLPMPDIYEMSIVSKDGHERHIRVHRSEVSWDGRTEFQCIYEDITERSRAEERLGVLSRRLLELQEEERRSIAMELHDEIGQSMTALKLLLDRQAGLADGETQSTLGRSSRLVGEILEQVRQFSLDLWPKMLDDLGLLSTLVWYFHRYTERTGVEVDFTHAGLNRTFGRDLNSNVYRIVQEALTNVARHASVDKVIVQAQTEKELLIMRIEDKGLGFEMEGQPLYTSTGLEGIRERARLLGGALTIDSAPGYGTRLVLEVPLKEHIAGESR